MVTKWSPAKVFLKILFSLILAKSVVTKLENKELKPRHVLF